MRQTPEMTQQRVARGPLAARTDLQVTSIPDLLIAATAEIGHRIVLHLDRDFDLIGHLTGQPLERLAPPEG